MTEEPKAEAQENKTERVQLLMAPSEVEAIDDWGFSHRIRTRAEAIRRLAALGLAFDEVYKIMRLAVETIGLAIERAPTAADNVVQITNLLNEFRDRNQTKAFDFSIYTLYDIIYMAAHDERMPYTRIDDEPPRAFANRIVKDYKEKYGSELSDNEIREILRKKIENLESARRFETKNPDNTKKPGVRRLVVRKSAKSPGRQRQSKPKTED